MDVDIKESTFKRLENFAVGFDTPDAVINRLMDSYENKKITKPKLHFYPNESEFLRLSIQCGVADVAIYKDDGSEETLSWKVSKLTLNSNLRANIWSGFLRNWKEKGIVSARFSTELNPDLSYEKLKILASYCRLTHTEFGLLKDEFEISKYDDQEIPGDTYKIRFFDSCDLNILGKIQMSNANKELIFCPFTHEVDVLNHFI